MIRFDDNRTKKLTERIIEAKLKLHFNKYSQNIYTINHNDKHNKYKSG